MKRLFYILFCLSLLACQTQNNSDASSDMVPHDKMVQVLADIHILEALIEASVAHPDTAVMVYNKKHKEILEKYGITKEQFHNTYDNYGKSLEEMDKLYETVLDTLTAREAKMLAGEGPKPEKLDSLLPSEKERADFENQLRRGNRLRPPKEIIQDM